MSTTVKKAKAPEAKLSNGLTALEAHAVKCLAKHAEKLRDSLSVGDGQEVDVTIRIRGPVNVGQDNKGDAEAYPKGQTLLALLLSELPDDVRTKAQRAVVKRCEAFVRSGEEPAVAPSEAARVIELQAALAHHYTKETRGSVTGTPTVELVARGRRRAA